MWNWQPGIALGNIRFGSHLTDEIISQYKLQLKKYDDYPQDIIFEPKDGQLQVFIENDIVNHIESWQNFFFKGNNLIGMNIFKAQILINPRNPQSFDNKKYIEHFDFDNLGLMLWLEDNIIISANAGLVID